MDAGALSLCSIIYELERLEPRGDFFEQLRDLLVGQREIHHGVRSLALQIDWSVNCTDARRRDNRTSVQDALAIVVKETGLPSGRVSSTVRQGGIYQEILDEANSMQPDLIVMSSHRPKKHAVRTYFRGSTPGHVVRYANCSVLVVRT